ncbi:MAG: diguanylate cyclase [Cyanobacteria bacterium SZAS LIN-2]|nr:diguanylate cyclase [Cyanobacteria bacterium SZAS LIN-3]MBS1996327.1 diguanylate cyclase [Cyanobacteria bacterium SZAS LIN-2]MBS2006524.1 diguanylate cyclase [Cyanobacteria bacterium SZAS TMP-1]
MANSSRVRLNIRARMLLLCLGVAAPLLAIGSFSLFKEYKTLKLEAEHATTLQAATGVGTLNSWVSSQCHSLSAVCNLLAIEPQQKPEQIKKILAAALTSQPTWQGLYLVSPDGRTVISAATASGAADLSKDLTADKNFVSAAKQNTLPKSGDMLDTLLLDRAGKPHLVAMAPLVSGRAIHGSLVASITPDAVLGLFTGLTGPLDQNNAVIAVIDANKRVIARNLGNAYWQGRDFSHAKTVQASTHRTRGTIEAVGIADPTPRAYAFDRMPGTNWLLVVGVPTSAIYGTAHDWLKLMIALAICAVGISVVLAYLATHHFTRTINGLVREALALGRGDFSKRVAVNSSDELGLLARAFNEMASLLEVERDQKDMVQRISESVRQSLDMDQILNTTVEELGKNLGASRCCLALIDHHQTEATEDDELVFDYNWWDTAAGGSPLNDRVVLIGTKTILRKIIDQGSLIWLDMLAIDHKNEIFCSGKFKAGESEQTPNDWVSVKSLVACPITTQTGTRGMILVQQCDHLRTWAQSELQLIEAVASQVALAIEHGRLYEHARAMAEQEQLINHIVRSVRTSLDVDTILDTVTVELSKALGADLVQIAQPRAEGPLVVTHEYSAYVLPVIQTESGSNEEGGKDTHKGLSLYPNNIDFHPNATVGSMQAETTGTVLGIDIANVKAFFRDRAVENDKPIKFDIDNKTDQSQTDPNVISGLSVIHDVSADKRCRSFREYLETVNSKSLIAAPLLNESHLIGVLIVHQISNRRTWTQREVSLVSGVADQLAVAITHAQLFAQVKHQAITDGLTTLYNHVYFKNRLAEELRLAERKNTPVSLIMIDLDKLKTINDNHGHPVGDAAIRQIAAILKTLLRSGDTAARYGGEEFGIILPETSLLEAALIADRLCSQIRNTSVPGLGKITASLGTACYPRQARSSQELIEKADKALYVAKNSGRDQVRVFEEDLQTTSQPVFTNVTREMERPESEKQR